MFDSSSEGDPLAEIDAAHAQVCRAQRQLLASIVALDRSDIWAEDGARDIAHWLAMRYGVSSWRAHRWIDAAHALEGLPALSAALTHGALGLDKVCELTRFATGDDEASLIAWARDVSCATVRKRADLALCPSITDEREAERARSVSWWFSDQGRRFGLQADLPAAQGAIVAKAIERMASQVPVMPGEEHKLEAPARRADALVGLCSAQIGADPDPDRATVVIHARLDVPTATGAWLTPGAAAWGAAATLGACEIEDGPPIHPETVKRLLCTARVQTLIEDSSGTALGMGRMRREPSAAMVRQVRYRDRGCRFPGCGTKAFTQAHHIRWWSAGGPTRLENLLLVCSFHHKLVHELGWSVKRQADGTVRWRRPDGTRYRAGPSPSGRSDAMTALHPQRQTAQQFVPTNRGSR